MANVAHMKRSLRKSQIYYAEIMLQHYNSMEMGKKLTENSKGKAYMYVIKK